MGFLSGLLFPQSTQAERHAGGDDLRVGMPQPQEGRRALDERGWHPSSEGSLLAFGGLPDVAGLPQPSPLESLSLPAVFACIRVLSETIASLPLLTYRVRRDGARERATDHYLYRMLHRQANPEMTAFEFEELVSSHCAGWGNAYAEMVIDGAGRVTEVWPLRPDRMIVRRRNGLLEYLYTWPNGQQEVFPAWRIHHRRALGGDGIVGYSPLRVAMLAVALGLATEEFGARFFSNGARPGFALEHPGALSDKAYDRLRASWREEHQGVANSHKTRILEEGMKIHEIGIPPEEAQFLQTRTFQAQEIARIFRVPPHKIGLLENATFSNIEHQAIEFVTDTIRPWLVRFEQAIWRDMLSAPDQESVYAEYLVDGLLRGDLASRYNAYATGRQWGWLSVNDIRRLENMDPVKSGDVYLQPLNMAAAGSTGAPGSTRGMRGLPEGENAPEAWLGPVIDDAAARLARREAADLKAQGVKVLRNQPEQFPAWLTDFYGGLCKAGGQMMTPVVAAAARASGVSERTLGDLVAGRLTEKAMEHRAQVRLVVSEAPGQGLTPAEALMRYGDVVESAGAQAMSEALLAAVASLVGEVMA